MIKRRGETFHFRLFVPKDIQNAVGSKEFAKSLGTGRTKEAKAIAHSIKAKASILWQRMRTMYQKLTPDEMQAMVRRWLDDELEKYADPINVPRWLTDHRPDAFEFFLDELSAHQMRLEHLAQFPSYEYTVTDEELAIGAPEEGKELQACQTVISELLKKHNLKKIDSDSQFYLQSSPCSNTSDAG
jgi:hypothetical protein